MNVILTHVNLHLTGMNLSLEVEHHRDEIYHSEANFSSQETRCLFGALKTLFRLQLTLGLVFSI